MTDDNTPDKGTVEDTADDPVDALADILGDPDEDSDTEEDEAQADDADSDDSDDAEGEKPEDDDAEDDDDSEDSDDDSADEDDDEPEDTGGKFVGYAARVRLPDGTTTTVEELQKGYLRQSDYTRKRQEDAELRKELDTGRERVSQTLQDLSQRHDDLEQLLSQWKPQPPQDPNDPVGYLQYQQNKEAWDQWDQHLKARREELDKAQKAEQQEKLRDHLNRENTRLVEAFPAMSDPAKRKAFFEEAAKVGKEYGLSEQEIQGITDHRQVLILRDLVRAKRLQAKAPKVKEQMDKKPKPIRGGKRSNGKAKQRRDNEERVQRALAEGSPEAFMDLDL